MGKAKPKLISATLKDITWSIEGSIDDAIDQLQDLKEKVEEEGWQDVRINIEIEDVYGDQSACVMLCGQRLETDEEFNKRLQQEQRNKEFQEQRDKSEWKRLQKKFGEKK